MRGRARTSAALGGVALACLVGACGPRVVHARQQELERDRRASTLAGEDEFGDALYHTYSVDPQVHDCPELSVHRDDRGGDGVCRTLGSVCSGHHAANVGRLGLIVHARCECGQTGVGPRWRCESTAR